MASFLKLRKNGVEAEQDARSLITHLEQQRSSLENLVNRASGSAAELEELAKPLEEAKATVTGLDERMAALERQMKAVETLVPQLAAAQDQGEEIAKSHRRLEAQLTNSVSDVERVKSQLDALNHTVETALCLKDDLGKFMELENPFRSLQQDAADLNNQLTEITSSLGRARQQHDDVMRSTKLASSRLEAFENATQGGMQTVEKIEKRVVGMEKTMEGIKEVASEITNTNHQLRTLKALSDQVMQKAASLEQQRDMIEKLGREADRLDELSQKVTLGLRQQEEQAHSLTDMTASIGELRTLHERVLARSEEITTRQRAIDEKEKEARQQFADLQLQLQKGIERFELESHGVESVSQRIEDLRGSLRACEERAGTLEESGQLIGELSAKTESLSTHVNSLLGQIADLNDQAARLETIRSEVDSVTSVVDTVKASTDRIEESKPAVDSAMEDLRTLSRNHEAIKDTVDQMRVAHAEMSRMREAQSSTESWLQVVQETVEELREQVKHLNGLQPTIESAQQQATRASEAIQQIESRRKSLDDMQTRLNELVTLGGQLDERTKELRSRIESSEGRFVSVSQKAEEVDRITKVLGTVTSSIEDAEGRIAETDHALVSLESRSKNLEALSDKTRSLAQEIGQRQDALDKASQHLERASQIRHEAADVTQQLEEQTKTLTVSLDQAEKRATRLESISEKLEDRSGHLRFVEKRMAQFEEKLGKWELAELELGRALEQVQARQGTVDALQADIKHMFDMAERTVRDVRGIATAQKEIEASRASLDAVLARIKDADSAMSSLDDRKRQIEQAEDRLARAEALLIGIQSSLETLQGQKALVDHVVEKAGSLTFQTKHAEALIDRLREEREITSRVRSAVEELRRGDEKPKSQAKAS